MRRITRSLILFLITSLSTPLIAATTRDQIELSLHHYKARRYQRSIDLVQPLLDQLRLNTVEEIIQAHRLLGLSHCELGDQPKALEHYKILLTFSPTETIDDIVVTKVCANLFNNLKGDRPINAPRAVEKRETKVDPSPAILKTPEKSPLPSENRPWKVYIPFGTGQFINEQPRKGTAFLAGEATAFATAIAMFTLFKSEENSDSTFDDPESASVYRGVFWGSLGVGIGLATWGIVDAILVHKGKTETSVQLPAVTFRGTSIALNF